MNNKNKAFTLAEVLITLTIIGVIAALTIPNLMQSYRKHQVEAGLKTAYSIIDNAIKMGVLENGDASDAIGAHTSDIGTYAPTWADTYLVPYLKIANTEYYPNHLRTLIKPDPFNSGIYTYWHWKSLLLENGMFVGVTAEGGYPRIVIWVDIDGPKKGPNRVAYDVFAFSYYPHSSSCSNNKYCKFGGKLNAGSASYEGMIKSDGCKDHGLNCAYVIQSNGWKIPDDYPVKKF